MIYGYIRVSTREQNEDRQLIGKAGQAAPPSDDLFQRPADSLMAGWPFISALRALEEDRALLEQHILKLGHAALQFPGGDALFHAQARGRTGGLAGYHGLVQVPQVGGAVGGHALARRQKVVHLPGYPQRLRHL